MSQYTMTLTVADRTGSPKMQMHFAEALVRRGHEVRVVYGSEQRNKDGSADSFLPHLQGLGVDALQLPELRSPLPYRTSARLARLCAGSDAVVAFQQRDRTTAMEAAGRLGVPGIVCAQNQHRFYGPSIVPSLKRFYYRTRLRRSDLVVCTAKAVRDELVDMGVAADRCTILPNGVPVSPELPVPRSVRRSATGSLQFVTVGRLSPQKGLDLLIRAWSGSGLGAAGHRLRIVGGPSAGNLHDESVRYAAGLEALARELGVHDSVWLSGPSDNVYGVLRTADAYVHGARWEGWPLAVMEAMDACLPVVMTDCSGWPEGFAQGTHGWVVPTGNTDELTQAMIRMAVLSDDERVRMGARCRKLLERHYDIKVIGDRFVDLAEATLSGTRSESGCRSDPDSQHPTPSMS